MNVVAETRPGRLTTTKAGSEPHGLTIIGGATACRPCPRAGENIVLSATALPPEMSRWVPGERHVPAGPAALRPVRAR